jgi:hypothetical protein
LQTNKTRMEQNTIKVSDEAGEVLFGDIATEVVEQTETPAPEVTPDPIIEETQEVEKVEEVAEVEQPVIESVVEEQELTPVVQETEALIQEPVKKVKKQVFKDEYHAAINKFIEENGTGELDRFVKIYNSKFDNLTPEEMIRQSILNNPDNAGISQKLANRLLEKEIAKYNLDSDDEDEVSIGKEELERDARAIKRTLEAQRDEYRSKYKAELEVEVDETPTVTNAEPTQAEIDAQIAEREAKTQAYLEMFTPFVKDGKMKLQDKDGFISVPVKDVKAIAEAAVDPVAFLTKILVGPDGKPNLGSFAELVAFATNRSQFKSALISYGNTRGVGNVVSELKNEVPLGKPRQVVEPKGPIDPNNLPNDFFEHVKVKERRVN